VPIHRARGEAWVAHDIRMAATKAPTFLMVLPQSIYLIVAPSAGNNNAPVFALLLRRNPSLSGTGVDNTTHSCGSQLVVTLSF
jgi:hypothetical protein